MRNVSDKTVEKNENTHTVASTTVSFFLKIVPFMAQCGKIWYSQTVRRWQYNTAHALCMPDD